MDAQKYKERILGRFDKVVRYFWDGLPTPPFVCSKDDPFRGSFTIRTLGYSPDYSRETLDIFLEPIVNESLNFQPLSYLEPITASMSSRIGSHYSPLVGFFSFKKLSSPPSKMIYPLQRIRIPVESCEDETELTKNIHSFAQCIRTNKLIELYEPLVREHSPISQESLKKIITLSTRGLKLNTRESVVSEVCCLSDEYVRWESEEIYYYLCINPLVRTILFPLKLKVSPEYYQPHRIELTGDEREALKLNVALAKKNLKSTLLWGDRTHFFFVSLHKLWEDRYENLTLFDLESLHGSIDSGAFLDHIRLTMKTVFTRIRIDFFSSVEELFFAHIPNAKEAILLCQADLEKSSFHRIFMAVDVFLTNQLRNFIARELKKLVCFFQCKEVNRIHSERRIALKKTVLSIAMVIGANSRVSLPSFSRLCIGISDLFEELKKESNSLPRVHKSIFRSLNIDTHPMTVTFPLEVECFRFMIINSLDKSGRVIDELSSKYSQYSIVPAQKTPEATKDFPSNVREVVSLARDHIFNIYCNLANVVYSGCFEIHCRSIKEHFATSWESYLESFYCQLNTSLLNFIMQTDAKCLQAQEALERVPQSVEELRALLKHTEEVKKLVKTIKTVECEDVILRISHTESNLVPIQPNVYESGMRLMKWPDILAKQIIISEEATSKVKPQLIGNLKSLRANTRAYLKTLSTGITELYNMFTFDIRDVAFQTCIELQNLVDQIDTSVKAISSQEALLGTPSVDSFEDFDVLHNHFDIISQYWAEINRSARLLEYYKCPIGSLKAEQMVEDVRECRRLIHSCTHRLRAYVPLVQLGRQQEFKLSKLESFEEILRLITIPGLRKHHWKEISRLLATKLKEDAPQVMDMTAPLHKLLDAGIMDHLKEVTRIVLQANNDFLTEEAVEEMKSTSKKFFFKFTKATWSHVPRLIVSEECRHSMLLQIEDFFLRSQMLLETMSLSAPVLNVLTEWKSVIDKLQKVIVEWNNVEERWSNLCNYMCVLQCKNNITIDGVHALILEKLTQTDESFKALNEIIRRPQFSLHVAIVQDTISDHVVAAKLTMEEATLLLPAVLDEMREGFPRFNFLTDSQLSSFLSSYDTRSLFEILPFMYPRLCRVNVEDDFVTAFTTTNNATIPALGELRLSNDPTEEWMISFDQVLKSSMASAMKACYDAFFVTDMKTWLTSWCTQFIVMSLRSVHTNGIREAVKNRGALGLKAHKTKIKNITAEVQRTALTLESQPDGQQAALSALSYLQFADIEIDHALSIGIASISELDSSPMIQTFITESSIVIRVMGIVIPYGLEFFGNEREPFFIPQMLEKAISILSLTVGGRSVPLLNHTRDSQNLLESLCRFCGLFLVTVSCSQTTTLDTMRSYLRGALGTGAFFFVCEYKKLSEEVQWFLGECFRKIQNVPLACVSTDFAAELALGTHGEFIKASVHPNFMGVITLSEPLHKITREFSQEYRSVYLPRVKLVEVIRIYLSAFGIIGENQTASPEFAVMYEHLQEIFPSVFTYVKLLTVLHHATRSDLPNEGCTTNCLFEAFAYIFASVLNQNRQLKDLLEFYAKYTLGLSVSSLQRALSASLPPKIDVKSDFAKTMSFCRQVIITGPHFSGKAKLWKDFVGTDKHVVLCTSLMTAREFYEHDAMEGLLKVLAGVAATPLERHFVVIEDETFLHATSWMSLSLYGRVLGPRKTSFTLTPSTYMIACTNTLKHTDPHVICDFAIFSLPSPSDWRSFLCDCLNDVPSCNVAAKVIEIVLPIVWTAAEYGDCSRANEDTLNTNMRFYAACRQCAKLYVRWYTYIMQSCHPPNSFTGEEVADPQLNTYVFAARCAVHAVCWSVSLALDPHQLDHIRRALLTVEDKLIELMENYDTTDKILPPLEDDGSILDFVVTRSGWRLLSDAFSYINGLSWSEYTKIDPQSAATSQRFSMPSRLSTLRAIECLINCGQHVLILGACGSGKSSLLHSMHLCERWVQHFVSCSKGFSAIRTQNQLASKVFPRSTSIFGPSLGSKLVVCIDDMHLSSLNQRNVPIASSLVLFYEKYSAISTPTVGFISTTDLVYVGATSETLHNTSVQCAFVNVYLPHMQGSELVNDIWKLLEAACGKRRTDAFPRECTSFIILSYRAVERAIGKSTVIPPQIHVGSDVGHPEPVLWSSQEGLSLSNTSSQHKMLMLESENILPQHFSLALDGVEIARQQLSSGISDLQVAANLFVGVEKLYVNHYAADANKENLRQDILQHARDTIGKCLGDSKFLAAIEQDKSGELYSDSKKQMCVLKWFEESTAILSGIVVQPLSEMSPYAPNYSLESKNTDANTELFYNRGQLSLCVTTASSITAASLSQNLSMSSPYLRELTQRQIKFNKGISRPEEQPHLSAGQKWKAEATTFVTAERRIAIESTIAHSRSLAENAFELVQAVKHMSSPLHMIILCKSIFEILSLVFTMIRATRFPVVLLRPYRGFYRSGKEAKYDFNTFTTDMKTLVNYAYANNVRLVVIIPNSILNIPLVLRQIDLLIRVGDLSEIFPPEELWSLVHETPTFHSKQSAPRRIMGVLSTIEKENLYAYIRQCFTFVLQVYEESHLINSLKVKRYRCFADMRILRGLNAEGVASMRRGVVYNIISQRNIWQKSSTELSYYSCGCQELADLAYTFCETIQKLLSDTNEENIFNFASLVNHLGKMCVAKTKDSALVATVLVDRGDVVTKLIKENIQLSTQASEELIKLREHIVELTKELERQNTRLEHCKEDFEKAQRVVQKGALELSKLESTQETSLAKAKEMLQEAIISLKKVKPPAIQVLSKALSSKKLILLIRAVYCVLGEEIPKTTNHPNELWVIGVRRMSTPGFVQSFISASTENVVDLSTLVSLEKDLKKAEFGKSSACAELIVDYILALINKQRAQQAKAEGKVTYSAQKDLNQEAEDHLKQCACHVSATSEEIYSIKENIKHLEVKCSEIQESQRLCVERGKRLFSYLNSIDCFTRFAAPVESIDEQVRRANCAQGDSLLMAAYNTFLSMHYPNDLLYKKLQSILRDRGVPFTDGPEFPARELLFGTHSNLIDLLFPCVLPFRHRYALYSLHQRIVRRWQLFGGVCEVFNDILREYLLFTCNGCTAVSVRDNNAKKNLIQAMQAGSGVLLYNLECDPMSTELVLALFPLFGKLDVEWENRRSDVHLKNSTANIPTKSSKGIPFYVFGQNIDVHPNFNLICVSFGLVKPSYARESFCTTIFDYVSLTNFFEPIPLSKRIWHNLLHSQGMLKNVEEELYKRRRRIFSEVTAFIGKHDRSSKLLSGDLEHISNCEKDELDTLDEILKDANAHDGQIATLKVQLQIIHKQITEAWLPIETSLKQCAELLRFIEADKLGRSWDDRVIDPFLSYATCIVPRVGTRFSSLRFKDQTLVQKQFYAVVNFIDNVVPCFSCGWPLPVRGIFSVLILYGTFFASDNISSYLETTFPTLEILKPSQFNALLSIIGKTSKYTNLDFPLPFLQSEKQGENADKSDMKSIERMISQVYLDSGDTLLKQIASKSVDMTDSSTSSIGSLFSSLVPQFFQFLQNLNFSLCEDIALRLYAGTLELLKNGDIKSTALRRQLSSHKLTETTHLTEQGIIATRNNSLVDCASSISSFSHSQASMGSCNFPLLSVHSREQLWDHNAKHYAPLYMVSQNPYATLYAIQHEAVAENWLYEQYEVVGLSIETNVLAIHILDCLLRLHMKDNFKGFWIGLLVDLSSPQTKKVIQKSGNMDYGKSLIESIHKVLATYIGWRLPLAGGNEDFLNRVSMRLALVCTPESHQLLWKNTHELRPGCCLYVCGEYISPQRHLLHLLQDGMFQDMLAQQTDQPSARRLSSDSSCQPQEKFAVSLNSSAMLTSHGPGTGALSADRRAGGRFRRGVQNVRGIIDPIWRILIKELCFVHVSLSERHRLLKDFRRAHFETFSHEEHHADFLFNDDAEICNDYILRLLIQLVQNIWCHNWIWRRSICELNEGVSERDPTHALSLIPLGGSSRGLRAHYYYRNQRRAWQQLRRAMAVSRGSVVALARPAPPLLNEGRSRRRTSFQSSLLDPVDAFHLLKASTIDFPWIQKLVYLLYRSVIEEGGVNVNVSEHETLKLLLRVMVVQPPNEADEGAEPTVTYSWPWLEAPCALALNASDGSRMTEDLKKCGSDLMELCGDRSAVAVYRTRLQQRVRHLLFSTVSSQAQCSGEAPQERACKGSSTELLELSSALQLSGREKLLKDLVPLSLEYPHLLELYNQLQGEKPKVSEHQHRQIVAKVLDTIRSLAFMTELKLSSSLPLPFCCASYIPEGNVQVWLPSLRYPLIVLWNLTRGLLALAPAAQHEWNFRHPSALVLIVTHRRLLAPCDVVLERASLSDRIMEEIHAVTGWAMPFASKQAWKQQETILGEGPSQAQHVVHAADSASSTKEEEIVIAVRSMCVKKGRGNEVDEFHTFNWSSTTGARTPLGVTKTSGPELVGEGEQPSATLMTWNVEPRIIEGTCFEHQPCEYLWNATINPTTFMSHLKLFGNNPKEMCNSAHAEFANTVSNVFVTQDLCETTCNTAQAMHSPASLSFERKPPIHYKVSQLSIPIMTVQFDFSQCTIEEGSSVSQHHRIFEAPLCLIYEVRTPPLSPPGMKNSQGKQNVAKEQSCSNYAQGKLKEKPDPVGTLGRYIFIE